MIELFCTTCQMIYKYWSIILFKWGVRVNDIYTGRYYIALVVVELQVTMWDVLWWSLLVNPSSIVQVIINSSRNCFTHNHATVHQTQEKLTSVCIQDLYLLIIILLGFIVSILPWALVQLLDDHVFRLVIILVALLMYMPLT